MAGEIEKLQERFRNILQVLDCENKSAGDDVISSEGPHIELIDFDEVIGVIREAVSLADNFKASHDQTEVVHNWLVSRIKAFRKAEACLKGEISKKQPDLAGKSPVELMHEYEDAAASLRQVSYRNNRLSDGRYKNDFKEHEKYKS